MDEEIIGVNESEPAEQTEEVNAEVTEGEEVTTEEPEATEEPELDKNAIFADARRSAERRQKAIDAQFAEKFKGYTNPITGKPITSAQDYYEAIVAQEQMQTKKTLEDKGIDPNLIEKAVENSPAMKTAKAIIEEQRLKDVRNYLDTQVKEISKLDPDVKSERDIETSERYPEVLKYINENRLSLVDAYKLVYADKLSERKTNAIKQQAVNNAKSQQHLVSTDTGTATEDNLVDIPADVLDQWKAFFPKKSNKELREIYNRSLHN